MPGISFDALELGKTVSLENQPIIRCIIAPSSAGHLALGISAEEGHYIATTFNDGEKYIRVESEVEGNLWVIANTNPPADNLLELFFHLGCANSYVDACKSADPLLCICPSGQNNAERRESERQGYL